MKTARRITVMILALGALAACGSDPEDDGNDVPSSWIRQEYRGSGAGYVDRTDLPSTVASEIDGHTSSVARLSDGDKVFLRYRNDIVAISPHQLGGSLIEVADYRTGYRRWKTNVGTSWPDPDSASFRGGGPGSGK
ncbi:DUF4247 domain-containing protein [Streptomyces coeruleoprunus]|uniref:DUF4247 domain-containing protein n=1 Tax=Streptomyces coeruleoprunus TaxID=285563 RepID=A0ABV9XMB4_9ACTN